MRCSAVPLLLLLLAAAVAVSAADAKSAPAPAPASVDVIGILHKAGQYTFFIRLLNQTQIANQIDNQAENSADGMTVFAATDDAFRNLPAGTLNNLSFQRQIQLLQYHICPKFYTLDSLQTVSNPVRTEASGQDGQVFGLNFSADANQVNLSTGVVQVSVNNAVEDNFPLAVFEVDKVLLPIEFYESTAVAPPPAQVPKSRGSSSPANFTASPAKSKAVRKSRVAVTGILLCFVNFIYILVN